jgi:hypothetical protein
MLGYGTHGTGSVWAAYWKEIGDEMTEML